MRHLPFVAPCRPVGGEMQFGAFGEAGRRGQEEGRVHGRRLRLAIRPIFPLLRTIGGDTG